ncbi:Hypothetical protein, putative [Bodo saltans]|uniref:Uncharacterized protein n=1 Tax=Bodo saltans TaxID=75058 RepID=A0A0S4J0E2_BODSA|nr:Hypothetical protein, putative [Bodo saltans]|eukprot:CUG18439.1 Hypothetical protein, putative [Bodo saltans]
MLQHCSFDINDYSAQTFLGRMEAEVLVTPPSYFVVKSRPYRFKGAVIVEVEYVEAAPLSYLSIGCAIRLRVTWN